jgi:hypothetical protein
MSQKSIMDEIHGYGTNYNACDYEQVGSKCATFANGQGGNVNANLRRGYRNTSASAPTVTAGSFVVPNYAPIGYDSLTSGGNGCNPYFNIEQAYGAGSGSCSTSYSTRLCSGCGPPSGVSQNMRMRR